MKYSVSDEVTKLINEHLIIKYIRSKKSIMHPKEIEIKNRINNYL